MNLLDYLGKPWVNGAAGPDAFDCWGLVRAVYAQRGIVLPVFDVDAHQPLAVRRAFDLPVARDKWCSLDRPDDFCAVLMSQHTHPDHVGVWWAEGNGVLHSLQYSGVVLSSLRSLAMQRWNVLGFYTWQG